MNEFGHIDLFTGIGGFTLACQCAGIQTEVMCEIEPRCQNFLKETYPEIPIIPDIRGFDGRDWQGRFLLTAGVPCQPASRAGKQRGKKDDRWLWDEALRVVEEAKPCWCLFENPPGIYDVGIDGILSYLESLGYETGIIEIPACAVNAPHIRQRVWILANASNFRLQRTERPQLSSIPARKYQSPCRSSQGNMADTENATGISLQDRKEFEKFTQNGRCGSDFWRDCTWIPCADGKLRRTPDDSFGLVDGLHRSLLAALGNSIVPQVAYEIIKGIIKLKIDVCSILPEYSFKKQKS